LGATLWDEKWRIREERGPPQKQVKQLLPSPRVMERDVIKEDAPGA
jgi:hypothetical protein